MKGAQRLGDFGESALFDERSREMTFDEIGVGIDGLGDQTPECARIHSLRCRVDGHHTPPIRSAIVRRFRKDYEWTQEDLADRAGLTTTYVGQVERGDKVPSLTVVLKLARALEVLPAELLESFGHAVMRELWR